MGNGDAPSGWFTADERPGLLDFWAVYEAHYDEVTRAILRTIAGDPTLASALQKRDVSRARVRSLTLLQQGVAGNWIPYGEHLREAAEEYASVDLTCEACHVLTRATADALTPRVIDAYVGDVIRLRGALAALWHFVDRVLSHLTIAFVEAKETAATDGARRYAAMLEAALDAIVIADHAGQIVEFNPAAVRLFGHARDQAIGAKLVDLLIPAERASQHLAHFARLVANETSSLPEGRIEVTLRRSDGTELTAELVLMRSAGEAPALVTAFIRDVTDQRETLNALADSEQRLRALAAHLQSAIEDERSRIAREAHDELGQQLTVLKLDLGWVTRRFEARNRDDVGERLHAMSDVLDATVETVHRIATRLRPGILDDLGLVPALEWHARDFGKRTGIGMSLTLPSEDLVFSGEHATAFFRIFQELLTNVIRHASATSVRVRLEERGGDMVLEVTDDGRGITAAEVSSGASLGLVGMRERVGLLRGGLTIEGTPGRGTTVTACIPVGPRAAQA